MAEEQNPVSNSNESDGGSNIPLVTGETKRGRGRPPGSKTKNKPVDLGIEKEVYSPKPESGDNLESSQFIGEAFVSGLELVESFVHSNCAKKIGKVYPEKLGEFRDMAEKSGLQPKDKELAQKCAAKIASKYDVLLKHAPEFVLGAFLVQYSLRQVALIRFVENVTKNARPVQPIVEAKQ